MKRPGLSNARGVLFNYCGQKRSKVVIISLLQNGSKARYNLILFLEPYAEYGALLISGTFSLQKQSF